MAAVETIFLEEGNRKDTFILLSTDSLILCKGTQHTTPILLTDMNTLVKAITGFRVAKIVAKIKNNMSVTDEDKIITIPIGVVMDPLAYTIWRINFSNMPMNNWAAKVLMPNNIIELSEGVIHNIYQIRINKNLVTPAASVGTYEKILFVDALPKDHLETLSSKTIYVLTKAFGTKKIDSAWSCVEGTWVSFATDET